MFRQTTVQDNNTRQQFKIIIQDNSTLNLKNSDQTKCWRKNSDNAATKKTQVRARQNCYKRTHPNRARQRHYKKKT